jgi:exoribonuclease-2
MDLLTLDLHASLAARLDDQAAAAAGAGAGGETVDDAADDEEMQAAAPLHLAFDLDTADADTGKPATAPGEPMSGETPA